MKTDTKIDGFLEELKSFSHPLVFNPWSQVDAKNDVDEGAPVIRLQNLRRYLQERVGHTRLILVAEAAGYQGCKFSGIAMTSERQLLQEDIKGESHYFAGEKRRTSKIAVKRLGFTEPTATIVWGKLREAGLEGRDWVNWNTFAWHPHDATALSNRTPTPEELAAGLPVLKRFLTLFGDVPVAAVGDKANTALRKLGVPVVATVRHPANGGATEFRDGISRLLE